MARKVSSHRYNENDEGLSQFQGGVNATDPVLASAQLGLIRSTTKGQPNGLIVLDGSAKISPSDFSYTNGTNRVSVDGNFKVLQSSITNLAITDYDINRNYGIGVSQGSVSLANGNIAFTAPAAAGVVNLTICGRVVPIEVSAPFPQRPSILTPVRGGTNVTTGLTNFTSAAFAPTGDTSTHLSSDWQIASDQSFTNIVQSVTDSTTNKTSWSVTGLSVNTVYYARVRYKGSNGNLSEWSRVSGFKTEEVTSHNSEEAKLIASDPLASDQFGYSVSTTDDGTRVAVGCPGKTVGANGTAGCVYVFVRNGQSWSQEAKIVISDPAAADNIGKSIAISSDGLRIVVSSPSKTVSATAGVGAVYIFMRTGTVWAQEAKLIPSVVQANMGFGTSVAITDNADRVAIGAINRNTFGAVYIFSRNGGAWSQEAIVEASDKAASDLFGSSVSISYDGYRLAVGSVNASTSGAVYTYIRYGTAWTQEAKLVATNPQANSKFGFCVFLTLDGDRLAVSAPYFNGGVTGVGVVYVFERNDHTWTQVQTVNHPNPLATGLFGYSLNMSVDNNFLVVGSETVSVNGTVRSGTVYFFYRTGTTWNKDPNIVASDPETDSHYGFSVSVAVSSIRTFVGAYGKNYNALNDVGAVYVYR